MTKVSIANKAVVKGKSYSLPVKVSGLPSGVASFEIIIQTEPQLLEMNGFEQAGMTKDKMAFCNNGVVVPGYITPYSKGKMIVVCADALPLTGSVMFNISATAVDTGTAVITPTYLLLNTDCLYGKRPELIKI